MGRSWVTLKYSVGWLAEGPWMWLAAEDFWEDHLKVPPSPEYTKQTSLLEMQMKDPASVVRSTRYLCTKQSLLFQPSLVHKCLLLAPWVFSLPLSLSFKGNPITPVTVAL